MMYSFGKYLGAMLQLILKQERQALSGCMKLYIRKPQKLPTLVTTVFLAK